MVTLILGSMFCPLLFAAEVVFPQIQSHCTSDAPTLSAGPGSLGHLKASMIKLIGVEKVPSTPPKFLVAIGLAAEKGTVIAFGVTTEVTSVQSLLPIFSAAQTIRYEGACVTRLYVDDILVPVTADMLASAVGYWKDEKGEDPLALVEPPPAVTP